MDGTTEIAATASNPRPSTCLADRPGAIDADVVLTGPWGGDPLTGEVTLVPDGEGGLDAYGNTPDHWISGKLVQRMHEVCLTDDDFRWACRALRSAVADAVAAGVVVGG